VRPAGHTIKNSGMHNASRC